MSKIQTIPNELLEHIMRNTYYQHGPERHEELLSTLLSVCSQWREVVKAAKDLWTRIIVSHDYLTSLDFIQFCIETSRPFPLHVDIRGILEYDDDDGYDYWNTLFFLLIKEDYRWSTMAIKLHDWHEIPMSEKLIQALDGEHHASSLQRLALMVDPIQIPEPFKFYFARLSMPRVSLMRLDHSWLDTLVDGRGLHDLFELELSLDRVLMASPSELMSSLAGLRKLTVLRIVDASELIYGCNEFIPPPHVLPSLQTLTFEGIRLNYPAVDFVFKTLLHIAAPQLVQVGLHFHDNPSLVPAGFSDHLQLIFGETFPSFPLLRTLLLSSQAYSEVKDALVRAVLFAVPHSIDALVLMRCFTGDTLLAMDPDPTGLDSSSSLCPNISSLTLVWSDWMGLINGSSVRQFIEARNRGPSLHPDSNLLARCSSRQRITTLALRGNLDNFTHEDLGWLRRNVEHFSLFPTLPLDFSAPLESHIGWEA